MKKYFFLLLILLTANCQVTETLHLNADGTGKIEVVDLRDEHSYMQLAKEEYSKEDIYRDTIYVFADYFKKYAETFTRTPREDQNVYFRYSDVKVHIKKSSYEKEFKTTVSQNFKKATDIVDLYKVEDYADNIKKNYALSAEEHYYEVSYIFEGNHFNRTVKITDSIQLKKEFDKVEKYKNHYKGYKLVQSYVLNYHFPRKIQSVSNSLAKISDDRKSLSLQFLLSDCLQNPLSTNLEVVLESESVD
ncbi:hypothetical protein DOS84_16780 [Flavobacterium aquariorum]|uniref:DUF4288 domain-containing protein n=1 Tax=Flavobacterium aquariorum TaxID=2217670 RepID=A0A2W7TPK8_9FLAO|nr:hypothetical protein [Flavobacterium aquariorum]PZX92191.1 hypothetical protein DOS84_16780 [Flavobacterium aquariorum]